MKTVASSLAEAEAKTGNKKKDAETTEEWTEVRSKTKPQEMILVTGDSSETPSN